MSKTIIVIGAGIGGLVAAIRLAHAGYNVTVLEKNPAVGGVVSAYHAGGFSWTICPPAFYARRQLEALYRDLGRSADERIQWLPIDPQTRFFFPDGVVFNTYRDWTKTAAEIAQLEPADISGYLRFLAFAARLHELRRFGFGKNETATASLFRSWLRAGPLHSAYDAINRYLRSDKLVRILAHYACQNGGSPYRAPSTANELAHTILNDGLWHPRGGVAAIPDALAKLAGEYGVFIRLSCPVKQIEIEGNNAIGVALERGGETLPADAVVSNIDPISTARYLLPAEAAPAPALRRLAQRPMSSSAFIMLLGIRGVFPQLAHQNIFFSDDYRREFDQIFRREVMPDDPTITLSISCKTDPLQAPVNQENWLIQVKAPALSEKVDWATQGDVLRDRILTILARRYGLELRDKIRIEKRLTPADLSQMSGAWRGALYGELPHGRHAALARPQLRSQFLRNLYHVGGAVAPGGGLPLALLSAKAAAAMLRQDLN